MKKTVVIAAAGGGTRLGIGLPKCLVNIGEHKIFEYLLKAFAWADEIRMVVGFMADEVMKQVSEIDNRVVFVHNLDFSHTSTRQSNFLGVQGIEGTVLFIDGDMIISRKTSDLLCHAYDTGESLIGVAKQLSEEPVYAGVEDGKIQWFSYDCPSEYEWANVALLDAKKLKDQNTHFYVQLEEYLPTKSVLIERLEIDTPDDLEHAKHEIVLHPGKYNFWR